MADIFEEVEEGIRQEKWAERWRKYGVFAYLLAAALIGGTALYEYMQYRSAAALSTNSSAFATSLDALEAGQFEAAAESFEALAESDARLSAPAGHMLAQVRLTGNGDPSAAAATLSETAGDATTATERLALLKAAYIQSATLDRVELEAMLAPVLSDETTGFRALARELLAVKAISEGDYAWARDELNLLRLLPNKPQGLDQRVSKALASLPADTVTIEDPEAAVNDPVDEVPE